ncbi:hypothetical protein CWT12_12250 [Actinomyces sp. 432]|uniref:hypothetical protein n=1 Tax=Actinomyces sp. 432 TaxID=2057798 RepID=UPI0013740201|nr:hypothetical protein [Actinomyces sp. 432]QHO91923.1 hypothetical protein CWT12_12250 [Actinomyces sp. 432]
MTPPPDFLDRLRAHLEALTGVPAWAGEHPNPRPDRYLYLERVGGAGGLAYDEPTITVEAWSSRGDADAWRLADTVRDHVLRHLPPTVGGVRVIGRSEYAGPSREPPALAGYRRYRWTIRVRHQLIDEEAT